MKAGMDERVLQARRQIGSEMMQWMYYFIVIAFCVKTLYFGMELRQCLTEYCIMIAAPLYQAYRSRSLGVVLGDYKKASKASTLVSVAIGIGVLLLCLSRSENGVTTTEGIAAIAGFAVAFSLARFGFARMETARAKRLEDEYDEE